MSTVRRSAPSLLKCPLQEGKLYLKKIIWTARYLNAPTAVRYCKHCGARTSFASSGLFRVNAQQKVLDIWLIFKCPNCDTTWNFTILSRVNPCALPPDLLQGFHSNDGDLAMRYATRALLKRNGAELGIPEIEILGEKIDFTEPVCIELTTEWPAEYKATTAIRDKLGISRSELDRLCDSGRIVCISGQNLQKCKLIGTIVIEIRSPLRTSRQMNVIKSDLDVSL